MIVPTLYEQEKIYERNSSMTSENKLQLIRMSEVELQPVDWLWYPYLPFGKLSMIQGDPGEGKTTLALRLAAACSRGEALPGMERHEPFNVLYQTAEDGLGDTIKPRLMDLQRLPLLSFLPGHSSACSGPSSRSSSGPVMLTYSPMMPRAS